MDEITKLQRIVENRESTITFLNELLDGQSERIERLLDENAILKEKASKESNETDISCTFCQFKVFYKSLTAKNEEKDKRIEELEKENKSLKAKLEYLFNAFEKIKGIDEIQKLVVEKKDASEVKKRHNKEIASKEWKKKREEVFERYGKQCVECGRTDNIQVHHLVYRKGHHLWEYNTSELIPLCKKCHLKIHEDKNHKFHEKYLL